VVAPYYRERGLLTAIDGMKSIDEVSAQIDSALDAVSAAS
jgi:adenylate kinase